MFYLENGSFMGTTDAGKTTCFQVSSEVAAGMDQGYKIQESLVADPAAFGATMKETRSIAGEQALCYVLTGAAALAFTNGTFRYTRTGVPLLLQWAVATGFFTMEATAYSTTVPDSDFALPATPMKVP